MVFVNQPTNGMCGTYYDKEGKIRKRKCFGQSSLVPYLSFEKEEGDHSQGNMVGGDMERLGKLVRKPCCTSLCKEYMSEGCGP